MADRGSGTGYRAHIVDSAAKIDAFLPQLADLAGDCLIVRDEVTVVQPGASET